MNFGGVIGNQPILLTIKSVPTPRSSASAQARVIVVDDHDWIREIAAQVVRQTLPFAEVVVRKDGLEALVAYMEGGADFVVTNHHMPRMDGMALVQELDLSLILWTGLCKEKHSHERKQCNGSSVRP